MTKVTLPWPPHILSPNARSHWAPKSNARKLYKEDCFYLAKRVKPVFADGLIDIRVTFHPPDKRGRDVDNMLSSIKAGLDAVADAWGVNDRRFRPKLEVGDVVKGGVVVIEVMP